MSVDGHFYEKKGGHYKLRERSSSPASKIREQSTSPQNSPITTPHKKAVPTRLNSHSEPSQCVSATSVESGTYTIYTLSTCMSILLNSKSYVC